MAQPYRPAVGPALSGALFVLLITGCASPPTEAPAVTLWGLGADQQSWSVRHPGGQSAANVSYEAGHVNGFVLHLGPPGLPEAAARARAFAEIPSDARLVFDQRKYAGSSDPEDQCDLIQYESASLGRVIGDDPTGIITVQLSRLSDNGFEPYDPAHITTASVLATGTLNDVPLEC